MTIQNRTVSIKNVFAADAETTIPNPPVSGQSYRNTTTTAEEIGEGWPYKEIVDSAKFNETMYEYSTICQQLEKYGFLPWCADTDYPSGGCALGTDGNVYQAKVDTGPSSTAADPVSDTSHTYWDLFYYSSFTASRAIASDANGKLSPSSTTATELEYVHGVTSSIQTQLNAKANSSDVVHKTGTETITGLKTIKRDGDFIHLSIPSITDSSTLGFGDIACYGNDSSLQLGAIEFYKNPLNQEIILRAYNRNNPNDNYKEALLHLVCNNNGAPYATVPASDVNGSIVTTVNKSKAAKGYFKYGNGMIINWGTQNHSPAAITITFATPFSSTNYAVTAILNTSSASTTERYCPIVYSKTTTNCVIWIKGTDGNISWQAIGY